MLATNLRYGFAVFSAQLCTVYSTQCTVHSVEVKVQIAALYLSSGACVALQGKKSSRWNCDAVKCPEIHKNYNS